MTSASMWGGSSPHCSLVLMCHLCPQIREDIRYHGINIYPSAYGAEDDEDAAANTKIEVRMAACKMG